jgi:hypothetical protein
MQDNQRLGQWLAAEVFGTPAGDAPSSFLAHLNASERTNMLYGLMRQRPELAAATQRLSLYDQLRLTYALVRRSESRVVVPVQPGSQRAALPRCFAHRAGAHGRPRRS